MQKPVAEGIITGHCLKVQSLVKRDCTFNFVRLYLGTLSDEVRKI
ncbi:hypothetical protein JCM15765_38780 [Paradesulfitobacterium aromaticivorans]